MTGSNTGREDKFKRTTEQWLEKHDIAHYTALHMRRRNDFRKDYIVKREIYEQHIKDTYNVIFVLDDRDQVVRM